MRWLWFGAIPLLLACSSSEDTGGGDLSPGDGDGVADTGCTPGTEVCNGIDDDCDGLVDDDDPDLADPGTWYADADADGYGDPDAPTLACEQPSGTVAGDDGFDCDDHDPAVHPGADETCDGIDDDCDGLVDDDDPDLADPGTWYADADADGYGDPDAPTLACEQPSGTVAGDDGFDCDDHDPAVHPGADESCDDIDDDCDGVIDEGCLVGGTRGLADARARLVGAAAGDYAGYAVAGTGDVDGDGLADLLVGAWGNDDAASSAGAAYLVRGGASGTLDLGAGAAAVLTGGEAGQAAGYAVAGAGDVDGDGFADLLVGIPYDAEAASYAGAAALVLGPVSGTLDLDAADARLLGTATYDEAGGAVSGVGDVTGDGWPDLLVGATGHDAGGASAGAAFLVAGPVSGTVGLDAAATAVLVGEAAGDAAGAALAGAGDVDGDGIDDVLVASDAPDGGAGVAWLVLGPVSGTLDLATADAILRGDTPGSGVGVAVAGLGDTDGDGLADFAIGGDTDDTGGEDAGAAWIFTSLPSGGLGVSAATAVLVGEAAGDGAGRAVAGAGDVDADGLADILVGAYQEATAGTRAGAAYLVRGPVSGTLDLGAADLKLTAEAALDGAGFAVAGVGDTDGDGHADLLVGGPSHDEAGTDAGIAWLLAGGDL